MKTITINNNRIWCGDPCMTSAESRKLGVELEDVKNGVWLVEKQGIWNELGNALRLVHKDCANLLDDFIEWDDFAGRAAVDIGMCGVFSDPDNYNQACERLPMDGVDFFIAAEFGGDGCFPVLVKYQGDEIVAIEVNFDREGWIFAYHHMFVTDEDIAAAENAVKKHDWDAYMGLIAKYDQSDAAKERDLPFFDGLIFLGQGGIGIDEDTFELATGFECECG